jgi:hypothetical protein
MFRVGDPAAGNALDARQVLGPDWQCRKQERVDLLGIKSRE